MGAGTPGGPGKPPMGDGGGRTPGKPVPPGIRPPVDGGKPGIRPPKPPKGDKSPEIFDKLLEGIKKGGFGGQRRPIGGMSSRPAPGSNIPLGPDDRPIGFGGPRDDSNFITPYGDTRDPNYAERKKAIFEKYGGPKPGFGTGPVDPRGTGPADAGPRPRPFPPRDPDFMSGSGPFGPINPRGSGPADAGPRPRPRKEAVFFGGKPPSTESRRPTKEGPKRGMRKAGPVDTETKNKFEEMLAYMKRFQK